MDKNTSPDDGNLESLNPRGPVEALRSKTRDRVDRTWGDRLHGAVDTTGKFFVGGARIAATTAKHCAAVLGYGVAGTWYAGKSAKDAFKSHGDKYGIK